MLPLRLLFPLLFWSAAAAGCNNPPPVHREDLAKCLPAGVTLSTQVTENGKTVEQTLAELGAHVQDGKLFDAAGKEIAFYQRFVPGANLGDKANQERQQKEEEELARLRETFTVIVITRFGV
jgi:hypothetical protein